MSKGMEDTEDSDRPPLFTNFLGLRVLARKWDYDLYCYYVAGTVGYTATELVVLHCGFTGQMANALIDLCEACGLGLQKTKIVKDFPKDLARGVCYLPSEWMWDAIYSPLSLEGAPHEWKLRVLKDVLDERDDFVSYITILPYGLAGYRLACLMCVILAFQTILKAARNHDKLFTPENDIKISRTIFLNCIRDAQSIVNSNESIIQYSHNVESEIYRKISQDRSTACLIVDKRVKASSSHDYDVA
jgi:farnesyl-diphosphate farnesyltransferase